MAADARAISRHVNDPRLRIVPVGVGAAYSAPGEAQSSYLVTAAGRSVAIDLGSGTLNLLQRQIAPEDLDALVITHLHPDHCVDLMALRVYMVWGPGAGRVLTVHGPPGLRERLVAFSGSDGWDRAFVFRDLAAGGGEVDLGDGLVLRHREVPHLPPTHAVRLEHGGRAICFSADCGPNDALVELARGCEVLVCECSFGAGRVPEGVPHLDARDAGGIAARAGAGRLLLVHCSPEFDRAEALDVAREAFGGPVAWARQGEAVAA
jgi:ribonuclease BN (tRNA processing enzyme)